MPFNLGLGEVLVVLIIALIVFGGRLPQVGRSLGQGLREFKKGIQGASSPVEEDDPDEPGEPERVDASDAAGEEEGEEEEKEAVPGPTPGDRSP